MLDELMEFEGVPKEAPKIYSKTIPLNRNPTYPKKSLLDLSKDLSKDSSNYPIKISLNRELTLGEKVLLRTREEQEKKKKAEIYKELHENKKMNLHQFLSRMQNYEQKKKYNLELKKYQKLQKETESIREKPKLSYNTTKICKTMPPKEPLYLRTSEVLEEHEQELRNLTTFYSMPKEIREKLTNEKNNTKSNISSKLDKSNKFNHSKHIRPRKYSAENTRNNDWEELNKSLQNLENFDEKKNKPKKMTKQKSDEFFEKQEKWLKNKRVNNQYYEKFYQIQNDAYSDMTFKPYISQATLEILNLKNRLNTYNDEYFKYNIPNSFSQYNNLILNKGKTIWDKLYEDAFKEKSCYEGEEDFKYNNFTKKGKFKNVSSKYFDLYNKKDNKIKNKRNKNNSTDIKKKNIKKIKAKMQNKSFDDKNKTLNLNEINNINNINNINYINNINNINTINSINNINNINIINNMSPMHINLRKKENTGKRFCDNNEISENSYYKIKEQKERYHWRNSLLNIKPLFSEPCDMTYHLNVMQSAAWNDNYVNKITFDNNTKCRSVINLVNIY